MDNGFADMQITKCALHSSAFSRLTLSSCDTSRYQEYVERFRSIFSASPSLPVYYLPGNHDVGLGDGPNTSKLARSRYRAAFGSLSQHVVLGGHSLLMVDAPALVDEDWRRERAGESRINGLPQDLNFLKHLRMQHVPGTRSFLLHTDGIFFFLCVQMHRWFYCPTYRSTVSPTRAAAHSVRGAPFPLSAGTATKRSSVSRRPDSSSKSSVHRSSSGDLFIFPFFQRRRPTNYPKQRR
jgi:3',5'-cyclic AMP phosphodiesterase CpdA